jgi:hypothetical protein
LFGIVTDDDFIDLPFLGLAEGVNSLDNFDVCNFIGFELFKVAVCLLSVPFSVPTGVSSVSSTVFIVTFAFSLELYCLDFFKECLDSFTDSTVLVVISVISGLISDDFTPDSLVSSGLTSETSTSDDLFTVEVISSGLTSETSTSEDSMPVGVTFPGLSSGSGDNLVSSTLTLDGSVFSVFTLDM